MPAVARVGKSRYRILLRYPKSVWPWLVTAVLLAVLSSLVAALQPLPLKVLVDNALGGDPVHDTIASAMDWFGAEPTPFTLILAVTGASFVLATAAAALGSGLGWLWEYIGRRMMCDLKIDLFDRLQRRSLADHRRWEMGDTLSRLSTDSWSIYSMTHALLSAPFERLLTLGAISVAAWTLSPTLALVTLGVAIPFAVVTYRLARRLRSATRRDRAAEAGVVTVLDQLLAATPIVQAFAAEERSKRLLRRRMEIAVVTGRRAALTNVAAGTAGALLTSTSTAVVLIVGGMMVLGGQATLGTLLVFLAYLQVLHRETQRLLGTHRTVMEGVVGLERVLELWGQEMVIADPADPQALPPANPTGARVELVGVTVGYLPGRPVLRDVDLVVEPGEAVALVGLSGAGKTTLASLLPRFLDPWEGAIRLDGVDLRRARVRDVRRRVAVVHQDPFLLPATIAENISYGRPDATFEHIQVAAREANAEEFIDQLPDGYDTILGEGGTTLSGGQRQRLAIARAFLKDAPLLVLDEPTSALDTASEALIVDAVRRITRNRTVIIIAHRLSTIQHVDRIVTLHNGAIANEPRPPDTVDTATAPMRRPALDQATPSGRR